MLHCACKISIYKHARVCREPLQPPVNWAWYKYSICVCSWLHLFVCFLFDVFWKRLHENLFCSSPTLSPIPGRKRLIGSNVRQISVSIPLFPCVNALSSKNTASLFIYCVRRWVLSFFPLPFFYGYKNRVCSCSFFRDQWVGLMLDRVRVSERESKKARVRRTDCAHFFKTDKCLQELRRTWLLCECERKKQVRVCS